MIPEELVEKAWTVLYTLGLFALALPLEFAYGTGHPVAWSERFRNCGALLVYSILGGMVLDWLLARPATAALVGFPQEPRLALLENPVAWALSAVFISDGLYYVYHRLQHSNPLLWRIHKLHHTDPAVNVTTSRRTHFLEVPLQLFALGLPVLWILGVNSSGFTVAAPIGSFFLYFSHLDVRFSLGPLTAVVVGPQYHRIHHARKWAGSGSNFAQAFPLFDRLGGTYLAPGKDEYVATGIEGCDTTSQRWWPIVG